MEKTYRSLLDSFPGMSRVDETFGDVSLLEYTSGLYAGDPVDSIQPRDDLVRVASEYAASLLGEECARLIREHLERYPLVQTANHHGADYNPLTVQGTLIFSLPRLYGQRSAGPPVVPVLACGLIPLSNITFPLGINLARPRKAGFSKNGDLPCCRRITVIPWKHRNSLVCAAGPFDRAMVIKSIEEVNRLRSRECLLESEKEGLSRILEHIYLAPDVLGQPDYSRQATVINSALWPLMFKPGIRSDLPKLAYLEMEKITTALIVKDLDDPDSLFHNMLFNPLLLGEILHRLDKRTGCWNRSQLNNLLDSVKHRNPGSEEFRGCGTVLFWHLDKRGHRHPLSFDDRGGTPVLRGICSGNDIRIPFTPASLREALLENALVPGLFASFSVLAFARGVNCGGGFYQVDYLPAMRDGLAGGLKAAGFDSWAENVSRTPTEVFLTGMNAFLAAYPDGVVMPAGTVELIASGGLGEKDLEKVGRMTVRDAGMCALLDDNSELVSKVGIEPKLRAAFNSRFLDVADNGPARVNLR